MKVGIIGGGASGLVTAWLIENDHETILFERQEALGGHAQTVPVSIAGEVRQINYGFEFFNDTLFPHFNRLLRLLNVKVKTFAINSTFWNQSKKSIVFPPYRDGKVIWKMIRPSNLSKYMQLAYLIGKIKPFLAKNDYNVTLEQFIESLKLTHKFKEEFFYPYIAAGWGIAIEKFKDFSAWDVLYWFKGAIRFKSPEWIEVVGGVGAYVNTLINSLQHTRVYLNRTITKVTYDNDKYEIVDQNGETTQVDCLVIATNAEEALDIIKSIPHTAELQAVLKSIEYFSVKIAVHSDVKFMPADKNEWSILNVRHQDRYSTMTTYKPWQGEVFRSWISPEDKILPSPLHYITDFRHVMVNSSYFKAQELMKKYQGRHQLWLAGIYTSGVDSHESAIKSAITIAKKLAPKSDNFCDLLGKSAKRCPFGFG